MRTVRIRYAIALPWKIGHICGIVPITHVWTEADLKNTHCASVDVEVDDMLLADIHSRKVLYDASTGTFPLDTDWTPPDPKM